MLDCYRPLRIECYPISVDRRSELHAGFADLAQVAQTEYLKGSFIDEVMNRRDQNLFDGMLRLLKLAGYNYKFIDLKDIPLKELKTLENLWIFSLEFMDSDTQEKIVQYLKSSDKKLFISPVLPLYDLNFNKSAILKDYLGITGYSRAMAGQLKTPVDEYYYFGGCEIYGFNPGRHTVARPYLLTAEDKLSTFSITKNNSDIIICGACLHHKYDFQIDLVEYLAWNLGIKKQVKNNNRQLNILLRRSIKTDILFASNYTEMPQKSRINLLEKPFPMDINLNVPGRKTLMLFANYRVNSKLTINFSTAEITGITGKGKDIRLTLRNDGLEIQLCCTGNYKLRTGKRIKAVKKLKSSTLYKITSDKKELEITLKNST